jgi:hypothetical protein
LNFLPDPHQHGSLRPIFGSSRFTVFTGASSPPTRAGRGALPLNSPTGTAAVAAARLGAKTDVDSSDGLL